MATIQARQLGITNINEQAHIIITMTNTNLFPLWLVNDLM